MLNDDDFLNLLEFMDRPRAGYRKVRKGVKKRVRRHMASLGCTTIEAYQSIIAQRPDERRRCEQALIVTISRFFRDRQLWQALREHVLPCLIAGLDAPVRIWSAGCANGEEAYSLAMIWQMLAVPSELRILASDVSEASLARAQLGIYNTSSLKEVPADLRSKFFRPHRKGKMILQPQGLAPIDWHRHDLFDPPPAGPFHMILLRNSLLTYHQGSRLRSALNPIVSTLIAGGYLVAGSHERLPHLDVHFSQSEFCPWIHRLG